jgi:hypothetical protein
MTLKESCTAVVLHARVAVVREASTQRYFQGRLLHDMVPKARVELAAKGVSGPHSTTELPRHGRE